MHPMSPWPGLSRKGAFHEDAQTETLRKRATEFVRAGVCINLSGAAGLGKTSLALRIAEELGRPISFMTGNQWLTTRDFVGREVGQTERTVIDKYVQSVRRTETESRPDWKSAILASSMQNGYTLIYDEFTRSSPEANSALLSVLEEGVLVSTDRASERSYTLAHEDFRVILTSNPHDYAGVKATPDALLDRVVTFHLPEPDKDRLTGIVSTRTGLDPHTAGRIVAAVLAARTPATAGAPTASVLRSAILVARVASHRIRTSTLNDSDLTDITCAVLSGRGWTADADLIAAALTPTPNKRIAS